FSRRGRRTRFKCDWSSDVCSSDLVCVCVCVCVFASSSEFLLKANESKKRKDRERGVEGKSVDLCGRRIHQKKITDSGDDACVGLFAYSDVSCLWLASAHC